MVPLEDEDAEIYAANSEGISKVLEEDVRAQDTRVLKVDVSELHKKGGGSVECMIGDLGE